MTLRITLRARLVMLVMAAIVPLFVMSLVKAWLNADLAIARATTNLKFAASLVVANQEALADSARHVLMALADSPGLLDPGNNCHAYFRKLKDQLPAYTNLGLIGANGYFRCDAAGSPQRIFAGDRPYFRNALDRRTFSASGFMVGRATGRPVITFGLPVSDAQGQATAIVFASLDLQTLSKTVTSSAPPNSGNLVITDSDGIVLASNTTTVGQIGQPLSVAELRGAVKAMGAGVVEGRDGAGVERIFAYMPGGNAVNPAFFVAVSADREAVLAPANRQLGQELAVLALVAFFGGWLAWRLGGRAIVEPATTILNATHEVRQGRLGVRISRKLADTRGEFGRIADGFNLMADSLQQRERELGLELERSRQAYATLELTVNSMHEGLIAVDTVGRFVLVNNHARSMLSIGEHSRVLSPHWAAEQGFYQPGSGELFIQSELPLFRALQGESGGPVHILMRNQREPQGRLLTCTFQPMYNEEEIVGAMALIADITDLEQLQAEKERSYAELREAQRKLTDAQRLGGIGNWELDLGTRRLWWSDGIYDLFGIAHADFDGKLESFLAMMHPDDRAAYQEASAEAMANDAMFETEYRIVSPGGRLRWIHQIGKPITDAAGHVTSRAGVVQDITSRKLSELAVAHHTELLNRTGEMAHIGGWELMLDRMVLVCSQEIYRIHEVKPARHTPLEQALEFYAPEARPLIRQAIQDGIAHGTPWDLVLPLKTAKGRNIQVQVQGQPIRRDGKTVRLFGALQDVTVREEEQAQLKLLETAVSRLNDIVLITEAEPFDEPGPRILFVNDAFERRTGYKREEVLGKSPRLLQGPKTQQEELARISEALRAWQPVRAELINYTKSGEEFWIELEIVPLADAKGWYTHWVAVERDITLRKRAEQALLDSERRYGALFDTAPVPMWVYELESKRFLAVNQATIRGYGYSAAEFLSMTLFDIRPESEKGRLEQYFQQTVPEAKATWHHMRKDGSVFPVDVLSQPIKHAGRDARFVVCIDMTAQVRAEKEVQDYLFTLQRAADAAQAITSHKTLERTLQEVADQARGVIGVHKAVLSLNLTGAAPDPVSAVSVSDKYSGMGHAAGINPGASLGVEIGEVERPIRLTQNELDAHPRWHKLDRRHGGELTMRGWLAVPLTRSDGQIIGLLQMTDRYEGEFTQQDVYVAVELAQLACIAIENVKLYEEVSGLNLSLEEKVVERTAALSRQEALARALTDQAPQIVWNADLDGKVTYANRRWYELMGGNERDWIGQGWIKAVHPDDRQPMIENWKKSSQSLQAFTGTRRFLAQDGTYHTMSYKASPVLNDRGAAVFWVGVDADITEIKEIETALRLSNRELEAFSYSVSHDLRSPLNTINGFSSLLAKQLGDDTGDKARHYLSRIQAGVSQMGRLIEDLLSLAQVSRMELRLEPVDMSALALEVLGEWRGRQPERRVKVTVEPNLHAQGDARLMRVLLENLLGNAWKFSSQRSEAEVTMGRLHDSGGMAVFFVRDNGAGFDMAYADKLFNTFQRLHAVTEFPGTGVGLANASRVVGRHGGQIWAQAKPDEGATFFFTLPRIASSPAEQDAEGHPSAFMRL